MASVSGLRVGNITNPGMKKNPPKLARNLLLSFLRKDLAEDVAGDLEEGFHLKVKNASLFSARVDYWRQVLNYIRPFAMRKLSGQDLIPNPMMYRSYFKTAYRSMIKNRMLAIINVTGLAIGMGVTLLLSLWIWDELSFNKSHANHRQIGQIFQHVTNNGLRDTWSNVPFPLADELRSNYGGDFQRVVLTSGKYSEMVSVHEKKFSKTGTYAEPGFIEMFSINLLAGDVNSFNDPSSVFLSASTANAFFGVDDPLGKIVILDGQTLHVAGVYEDIPEQSELNGLEFIATWQLLYNVSDWMRTQDDPWRPNAFTLYVQLAENSDFTTASAKIKDAKLRRVSEALAKKKPELFIHPMDAWHLYAEFKEGKNIGGGIQYVWLFGIIASFVLLMACINFMNLMTSKSEQRSREVGIRKSIGSLRTQLMTQFVSESFLISIISFLIALLGVVLLLPAFNGLANKHIIIEWASPGFWLVTLGFCFFTGLLAGSYPAFYLSGIDPGKALKGSFKAGTSAAMFRKALVVMQFTISVILIVGTVTVYRQIEFARNRPVGYDRTALLSIRAGSSELHKHFDALANDLTKSGAVIAVAESYGPPTSGTGSTSQLDWKGKDPNLSVDFSSFGASIDYGKTVGWEIIAGRDFQRDVLSDSSAIILNESAVRYMGLNEPVGEVIRLRGEPRTVVGVIRNMVFESPYEPVRPALYSLATDAGGVVVARLNPALSLVESVSLLEKTFKRYAPDAPFDYRFVDAEYARKFGREDRIGKLSSMFTLLAIFISCLGIFGLSSFVAEQRTKEIGVRKVLGASVFNLWKMLCGDFVVLVAISCIIAAPIAYYGVSSWLTKYDYRTTFPWWMIAGAGSATLVITLVTVSYHTLKAASMKPVNSLRSE
jgi:putative ABC transport system permease protein